MYHYTVTQNLLFLRFIEKDLWIYFYFFPQLPRGIQKAFFILLRMVLSSFTHKKLSSYYFPLVNECHNTAVNALYPSNITFKTNQSIPQWYTFSKTYVIVKKVFLESFSKTIWQFIDFWCSHEIPKSTFSPKQFQSLPLFINFQLSSYKL